MTLHRRLVVATVLLTVTIVVAGLSILGAQRHYAVAALDAQLTDLSHNPRAVLALSARAESRPALENAFGDLYVGRLSATGRLTTVLAPRSDPNLVPLVRAGDTLNTPTGRTTQAGAAARVRVVALPLGRGDRAVIALPTTDADAATARLARTLLLAASAIAVVLGLILWWVIRLGLRPVEAMTRAADAIAAGDTDRRVPPGPPGTEAARLGTALNAMLDATRAGQERTRRFVADASHELRTPLTTLRGYSGLHAADPEVGDALRRINAEATRMSGLVDDLLTLTALDARRLVRGPVDVAGLLADVAADLQVTAPERVIEVETPSQLIVEADAERLHQAVLALGTNALRHTPTETRVCLRGTATGDGGVKIEVTDAGPGIAPEHLPHLFDRFYRAAPSRTGPTGSGLGLAVVAAIADAHGGRYAVASAPAVGSTFTLVLPGHRPDRR